MSDPYGYDTPEDAGVNLNNPGCPCDKGNVVVSREVLRILYAVAFGGSRVPLDLSEERKYVAELLREEKHGE